MCVPNLFLLATRTDGMGQSWDDFDDDGALHALNNPRRQLKRSQGSRTLRLPARFAVLPPAAGEIGHAFKSTGRSRTGSVSATTRCPRRDAQARWCSCATPTRCTNRRNVDQSSSPSLVTLLARHDIRR